MSTDPEIAVDVAYYVKLNAPVRFKLSTGEVDVHTVAFFKPTEHEADLPPLKSLTLDATLQWIRRLTGIEIESLALMPLSDFQAMVMGLLIVLDIHIGEHELADVPRSSARH